jgi:PAS domain S-box-containing protein
MTGRPAIVIGHPLLGSSGEVERVIFASIELDQLEHLVATLELPRGVQLTVFDRDRTILVRYPDPASWIGKPLPDLPAVDAIALGSGEEIRDGAGADGVRRLYASVGVQANLNTGLSVEMSIERAVAFAEADRLLQQQMWLLALLALAAVGTAWLGATALVLRPIEKLKTLTQRLAGGDFRGRAQLAGGAPGLHELSDAVDSMAAALERREREHQLSDERYREMFMNDLTGAWIATPAHGLVACNPAFASMFGFASVDDALRLDLVSIYKRPEEREEFLDRLRVEKRIVNRETEYRRPDGKPLHVIQNAVGVFDECGDLIEIRGCLIDTTQQKHLEDRLRQAYKMEAVGRLAGGVAHDFNNILTVIVGCSEFLIASLEPGTPGRADAEEIRAAGQRASDLTRQLLAFSRRQVVQPIVLDVNATVTGMDRFLRRLLGEDVSGLTTLTADLARVRMDPTQIEQLLANLAVNARDAMPDGGTLTIETAVVQLDCLGGGRYEFRPGRYVLISVGDTGTGIDAETLPHIFEPFFTTKEVGRGTGLGLSMVYGIVKQADGFVEVRSTPGRTTFEVYLPWTDEPLAPAEGAPRATGQRLRGLKVLVVEDDTSVRELIRRTLDVEGCQILEAGTGLAAQELLEQHHQSIDLVLTDVVMPGMTGWSLAEQSKRRYPDLKILFISGYPRSINGHEGVDPARSFLAKPFSPDALRAKVLEMLG